VLDSLGGAGLRKGYRCVARGGMLVTIGAAEVVPSARNPVAMLKAGAALARAGWFQPLTLLDDNRGIAGIQGLGLWDDLPRIRATLLAVIGLWEQGVLTPHIDRVFDFAEVASAHTLLESRQTRGKLVLRTSFARSN
jgi:NADPH:quinone reductase-like Zn-dependent oxidoreductase